MEDRSISFFEAIKRGDRAAVEAYLAQEPDLVAAREANGISAVLTAAYYGEPDIQHLLIEHGAPLDIFVACASGVAERTRDLLDAEPSLVNAWAVDGYQPLGLACFFGHADVVRLLLERGAEVNTPSRNQMRVQPLNSAVAGQRLEIARLLLDHGGDANARQGEDFSPLHGAAQNGQVEMITLLLASGADPTARSANGKLPIDYAEEGGHSAAAALLRNAGTQITHPRQT